MNRNNIEKITHETEDRILLAKLWDKINNGISRNIPANTSFLTPREQEMAKFLFGNVDGLYYFGGYENAERKMLIYLPDYFDESYLYDTQSPLCCLRAEFYEKDILTHRDFLGALMGSGIARGTIGDICVCKGSCDFLVCTEVAPYILQNLTSAGRTKLHIAKIPLTELHAPDAQVKEIRDTVASIRLDSIVASGFHIGRKKATDIINSGNVSINSLTCIKPDKSLNENDKVAVRGFGKLQLKEIGKQTKKGRISVTINRYI